MPATTPEASAALLPEIAELVGGFIVLTNARTLLHAFDIRGAAAVATYLAIVAGWGAAVWWSVRRIRQAAAAVPATAEVTSVA